MAFDFNKVKRHNIEDDFSLIDPIRDKLNNAFDFKDKTIWFNNLESEFKNRIQFTETKELKTLGNIITFNVSSPIYDEPTNYMQDGPVISDFVKNPYTIKKILISIYKKYLNKNSWMPNNRFFEIFNNDNTDNRLSIINQGLHKIDLFMDYQLDDKLSVNYINDTENENVIITPFDFDIKNFVEYMIFINNIIFTKKENDQNKTVRFMKSQYFEINYPANLQNKEIVFTDNGAYNFINFLKWGVTQKAFKISINSRLLFKLLDALPKTKELGNIKILKNIIYLNTQKHYNNDNIKDISENTYQLSFNDIIANSLKFMEDLKI
jgi:hypothetical protein